KFLFPTPSYHIQLAMFPTRRFPCLSPSVPKQRTHLSTRGNGGSLRRRSGFHDGKIGGGTRLKKRGSSGRWLDRHLKDPYVAAANEGGLRARSAFKLLEMHQAHTLLRQGSRVVDLGAAPGGWSELAARLVHWATLAPVARKGAGGSSARGRGGG
ncbi:unnamed protein product, partial [Discosporangium mesarthrocarpum]